MQPLGRHDVHVWLFSLGTVADVEADVDDAAREHAAELRFEDDRRRYLAGRACVRRVRRRYSDDRLCSNLSHSGELIAVAVARRPVGVDVEQLRGEDPDPALVARACTRATKERIERLAAEQRERAFLREWVRKEALGKALGVGLDLSLMPARLNLFPRTGGYRHTGVWRVLEVETPEGYVGAIATRGLRVRVAFRR